MIKDNVLTIISPVKKAKQFQLNLKSDPSIAPEFEIYYDQKPIDKERTDLINETVSYYQTASRLLKDKKYQK